MKMNDFDESGSENENHEIFKYLTPWTGVPTLLFLQDSILLLSCLVSSPTALLSNRVRGVDTCDSLWPNYPFCVSQWHLTEHWRLTYSTILQNNTQNHKWHCVWIPKGVYQIWRKAALGEYILPNQGLVGSVHDGRRVWLIQLKSNKFRNDGNMQ